MKRRVGSSSASTVPSGARAARAGLAERAVPLVVMRLHVVRSPRIDASFVPGEHRDIVIREHARRLLVRVVPTRSGTCCSRSPPSATFSTCEPRQIASTGRSRSSAALHQPQLEVVPLAHHPVGLGVRLSPYSSGSRSEPPEKISPSTASSVSSSRRPAARAAARHPRAPPRARRRRHERRVEIPRAPGARA